MKYKREEAEPEPEPEEVLWQKISLVSKTGLKHENTVFCLTIHQTFQYPCTFQHCIGPILDQ
jgi:hypothetical protein